MATIDPKNDLLIVYDASDKDLGRCTLGELLEATLRPGNGMLTIAHNADGRVSITIDPTIVNHQDTPYTPGTLPPAASSALGATLYCEGMGGGGGPRGLVYNDGTNWRKARNNSVVA